jgi:hypothetical protein
MKKTSLTLSITGCILIAFLSIFSIKITYASSAPTASGMPSLSNPLLRGKQSVVLLAPERSTSFAQPLTSGGGCADYWYSTIGLDDGSCISINAQKQVIPNGYLTPSGTNGWGLCEVEVDLLINSTIWFGGSHFCGTPPAHGPYTGYVCSDTTNWHYWAMTSWYIVRNGVAYGNPRPDQSPVQIG